MPTLSVNGRRVTVDSDATILDAARTAGVKVPTLCQFDGLEPWGGCRLCVVDMSQANWDDDYFKVVRKQNAVREALEEGHTYQSEYRIRHRDGHYVHVGGGGRLVRVGGEPSRVDGAHRRAGEDVEG